MNDMKSSQVMEQHLNALDPQPHSVEYSVKALYYQTPKTKTKVEQSNIPPFDLASQVPPKAKEIKEQESFRNKRESIQSTNLQTR
jgi:hypothetical protein